MECPKCGLEIEDKAMVCPNCKKVLKLSCPICRTINDNNTCKKCGYVIISKCKKCGKVNQTFSKNCKKCGYETEKSVIQNESNTDDFVMITLEFPNLDDMKTHLGSVKLFNKFKINLDKIILDYTKSIGLRRQLVGKTYVIRCNRDYTFNSSVSTAIKTVVELLNKITAMNCKLSQRKNASIRSNVFLLKRNVEDDPNDIDSGFNISLLNQSSKSSEDKLLSAFQILTDDNVSDSLDANYTISPLNSVMVNDEMVMFYEVDLKPFITVEYPEIEDDEAKIPNFVQNMLVEQEKLDGFALNKLESPSKDNIYEIKTINFDEINCEFIRTENINVFDNIAEKVKKFPKGIIALKTPEIYKPYTIKVLNTVAESRCYNNIISLTCYDEMKFAPYSFFRDLVSAIFEYTVSQKLFLENDFSMFSKVDPDGLIRDLITLHQRPNENTEDTRYVYFDIFMTLLQIIPKTLIYIEDFEKIDASSYDVLKFIFEAFEQLDIAFLISYDKEFSLHKDSHFLLSKPYYTEITLLPTPFEKVIEDNKLYYRNILDNFYFQRIAKYACGSGLFVDIALQYLIESGVYEANDDCIRMVNPKTIIIPSNMDRLLARRVSLLQDDTELMKFLASIILLGTRIDMGTISSLGYQNTNGLLDKLADMGYLYEFNNCIYFPNYNLLRKNILSTMSKEYLRDVANDLFTKVFNPDMPSDLKAYLYGLLGEYEKERNEWEALATINLSLGDFSAYLHCTDNILKLLEVETNEQNKEEFTEYKKRLYEDISNNLYDYVPEKISDIAKMTLCNLELANETEKVIMLCSKMINGALSVGDYNHALELTHKVLYYLPTSSLNPADENFNSYFFLMSLAHIQILFNIGALVDCLEVGYKVLNIINDKTLLLLKPENFTEEEFRLFVIDSIGYIALANALLMTGNTAQFLDIAYQELSSVPKSYNLFVLFEDFLKGKDVSLEGIEVDENDRFGDVIRYVISAFQQNDNDKFALTVYKAKLFAKANKLHVMELFTDLLIAYAYLRLGSYVKAEDISFKIIKTASDNGIMNVLYAAWFVMSELNLTQHKYDVAFGIINNSLIQLEKMQNTSEYLLMLFKYNMFKVMMYKGQIDKAKICIAHANYIAQKYGVNFEFDADEAHYIPLNQDNDIEEFVQFEVPESEGE